MDFLEVATGQPNFLPIATPERVKGTTPKVIRSLHRHLHEISCMSLRHTCTRFELKHHRFLGKKKVLSGLNQNIEPAHQDHAQTGNLLKKLLVRATLAH